VPTSPSFKLDSVSGTLRFRRQSIDVKGRIRVDPDGLVRFALNPIKLVKANSWILKLAAPKTRFLPKLIFEGGAGTGEHVVSNSVFLDIGTSSTPTSATLRLKGKAYHPSRGLRGTPEEASSTHIDLPHRRHARLREPDNSYDAREINTYRTLQDRRLQSTPGPTSSGSAAPRGSHSLKKWITSCDRLADRVLEVISFAEGRLIKWSVRSLYKQGNLIAHEFFGPQRTTDPHSPVFYFLNLQPVLDLAVSRYTQFIRRNLGFGVALEWCLQRPSYSEVQLLTAMTAIEHLISVFKRKHGAAKNMAAKRFSSVIKPARKRLGVIKTSTPEARVRINLVRTKLSQANEAPLQVNLEKMLRFYKVPVAGLETRLAAAIKARNRVVHSGLHSSKPRREIHSHVAVLRELFTRIFLSVLRYNGRYQTWLDDPDQETFPPAG
jgi:hypothetical protein